VLFGCFRVRTNRRLVMRDTLIAGLVFVGTMAVVIVIVMSVYVADQRYAMSW
jgi:hypothetical protein